MLGRHLVVSLSLALTVSASNLSAQIILVLPAAALDREAYVFVIEHQTRGLD
jgi:hypothetical protein